MKTIYVKVVLPIVEKYPAKATVKDFRVTNKGLKDLLPILESHGFHYEPTEDGIEVFLKEEKYRSRVKEIENLIKPEMLTKKKISITLHPWLLKKVNEYGAYFRGGRCGLIEMTIRDYIKNNEEWLERNVRLNRKQRSS